jgi:hypothetical protein
VGQGTSKEAFVKLANIYNSGTWSKVLY